jgi:aminoglycoside phosphotransferase (APT) family kinase protein
VLDALLGLVELQADAGIPAGDFDFTGYLANVLFDDWDEVWADAAGACAAAGPLCARLRSWLQPVWGLRLPPVDYAHNDLNLSNVLTNGERITGVVDWDGFGLGSRALDLVALAFDYRIIGGLAAFSHERQAYGDSLGDEECAAASAVLDRLQAISSA